MLKDLKIPGEPSNISQLPSQCILKMCLETSSEVKTPLGEKVKVLNI